MFRDNLRQADSLFAQISVTSTCFFNSHKNIQSFVSLMFRNNLHQAVFFFLERAREPVGHVGGDHAAGAATAYAVFAKNAMNGELEGDAGDFAN